MARLLAAAMAISIAICLPQCYTDDVPSEKTRYISKLIALYTTVGLADDETALLGQSILPGMIVDKLNSAHTHPGSYMHARDITLNHLDLLSGDFSILLTTQSLADGTVAYNISGNADFKALHVNFSNIEQDLYRSSHYTTFNNGSKGWFKSPACYCYITSRHSLLSCQGDRLVPLPLSMTSQGD